MSPSPRRSHTVAIIFGFAFSAFCIWRVVREIDYDKFISAMQHVHVVPLVAAIVLATLGFPLRIPRWRLLLPAKADRPIPTASLWHAITIGFTANNVIPLRVGEVVRAATLTRLEGIPFATTFASLAVERVLDGMTMIALLGVGLVFARFPSNATLPGGFDVATKAWQFGFVCIAALVTSVAAAWRPAIALGLLRRIAPRNHWGEKFLHFAENVLSGLSGLRDPRRAIPVVAWSFVFWSINGASFWLGFHAFGIPLSFFAALVLQGVVVVAIAIPSSPGGFGAYEFAIQAALSLYAIDESVAAAYAIGFHLLTLFPLLILGAWSAKSIGATFRPPVQSLPGEDD